VGEENFFLNEKKGGGDRVEGGFFFAGGERSDHREEIPVGKEKGRLPKKKKKTGLLKPHWRKNTSKRGKTMQRRTR